MAEYLDLRVTLSHTTPAVWRQFLLPVTATFQDLHQAICAAFEWEGMPTWELPDVSALTPREHFASSATASYHYIVDGARWEHVIECLDREATHPTPAWRVFVGGEHAAPTDDLEGPEQFAQLVTLARRAAAGESIGEDELPEDFELEDLDLMTYDGAEIKHFFEDEMFHVASQEEREALVHESFEMYATALWPGELEGRSEAIQVFRPLEAGCLALGFPREHAIVAMSYWMFQVEKEAFRAGAYKPAMNAAATLALVDALHAGDDPIEEEELLRVFGLDAAQGTQLAQACEVARELYASLRVEEVIARANAVHDFGAPPDDEDDDMPMRERIARLWEEVPGLEVLEFAPPSRFSMILEVIRTTPEMAREFEGEELPDYTFMASADTSPEPLMVLPWYGELELDARHDALIKLFTMACVSPEHAEPTRPLLLFVPEELDAKVLASRLLLPDLAISTHAELERQIQRERVRQEPSKRGGEAKKKKKAQSDARKKQRKKKK